MALENLSALEVYIALAINGIFTGIGVAIGTYIAQRHVIDNSRRIVDKLRKIKKRKLVKANQRSQLLRNKLRNNSK